MPATEQEYIDQFRQLVAARNRVLGTIARLRGVCSALGNWQKAAEDVLTSAVLREESEWHSGNLKELGNIRPYLEAYQHARNETVRLWQALKEEQRTGLAEPSSLDKS